MAHDTKSQTQPKKRRRRTPGWVPDQHGAWAMLAMPLVIGAAVSGFRPLHLLLAVAWFLGYFAFFAAGLWFKSHFKSKYVPPLRAYAIATALAGGLTIAFQPALLWWAPAFAPLLAISLWCSYRRRDRSLLNDLVTVAAACLMLPVAAQVGAHPEAAFASATLCLVAIVFTYFFGTVLYVKTVIRERGSRRYLLASYAYHFTTILLPSVLHLTVSQWRESSFVLGTVLLTAFFVALAGRAVWVPRTRATPKQVGVGEVFASLALAGILLFAVSHTF